MNIVVIGLGEVGRHLLSVLDKEGHDIIAVDSNAKAVQYAEEHYDVASIIGYGASETLLKIAGVGRSDLVVAVTNHDEMNLIAALASKQLGAKHVVARVQGTAWSEWTEGIRYGLRKSSAGSPGPTAPRTSSTSRRIGWSSFRSTSTSPACSTSPFPRSSFHRTPW